MKESSFLVFFFLVLLYQKIPGKFGSERLKTPEILFFFQLTDLFSEDLCLAGPTLLGNEGPSTFTGWYIGDETELSFPKGQLVVGSDDPFFLKEILEVPWSNPDTPETERISTLKKGTILFQERICLPSIIFEGGAVSFFWGGQNQTYIFQVIQSDLFIPWLEEKGHLTIPKRSQRIARKKTVLMLDMLIKWNPVPPKPSLASVGTTLLCHDFQVLCHPRKPKI